VGVVVGTEKAEKAQKKSKKRRKSLKIYSCKGEKKNHRPQIKEEVEDENSASYLPIMILLISLSVRLSVYLSVCLFYLSLCVYIRVIHWFVPY